MRVSRFLLLVLLSPIGLCRADWIKVAAPSGRAAVSCFAASSAYLFAGTTTDGVYRSTDNGSSWSAASSGLSDRHIAALLEFQGVLYAGTNTGVNRSTDDGTTWEQAGSDFFMKNATIKSLAAGTGAIYAGSSDVYRSLDNGATWTTIHAGWSNGYVSSIAVIGNTAVAGISTGGAYRLTSGSDTWSSAATGLTGTVQSMTVSGADIIAGADFGDVFRSTDAGATWNHTASGVPTFNITALCSVGALVFAGTSFDGVFVSEDHGDSWRDANGGLSKPGALAVYSRGTQVFIGDNDVYRRSVSEFTSSVGGATPWCSSLQIDILCANPVHDIATVRCRVPASAYLHVDVVDIEGNHVNTLYAGLCDGNGISLPWNTRRMKTGTYFLSATAGGERKTVPVAIVH